MKRTYLTGAALAVLMAGTAPALADCAAELERMGGGEGIAKDGSTAPLEGAGDATPGGGEAGAVATSPADVEAQQEGEATAAGEAAGGDAGAGQAGMGAGVDEAALTRARAALAAGDEAGCMEALGL
jgi:hypothetical protein